MFLLRVDWVIYRVEAAKVKFKLLAASKKQLICMLFMCFLLPSGRVKGSAP